MQNRTRAFGQISRFYQPYSLFMFIWLLGLLLGTFFAACVDDSFFSVMRPILLDRVSIFGRFSVVYLPFLFAAYAVAIEMKKLLFPLCFLKAFHFSFCGHWLFHAYGSAGWLVRLIMQFTEILSVPIFFFFCLRHTCRRQGNGRFDFVICLILVAVIVCIDYFVISPLWPII